MPILLFAVAFGLSTDYGVFLLSRIKEARDDGAGDSECVAIGLERTGRIVTAAALLFAFAIGAFATSQIIFIKENGIGVALAVLIDATHHPRPAGALPDGAARPLELVGARAAAPPALADRAQRDCRGVEEWLRGKVSPAGGPSAREVAHHGYPAATVTIATAMFLIAAGAILRYAITVETDVIDLQTVGLILMIAGGAGLALSLLYELVQQGGKDSDRDRDDYPQQRGGYDDPTRRMR